MNDVLNVFILKCVGLWLIFLFGVNVIFIFLCLICGLCIKWFIVIIIFVRLVLLFVFRSVVLLVVIMVCFLYDGNFGNCFGVNIIFSFLFNVIVLLLKFLWICGLMFFFVKFVVVFKWVKNLIIGIFLFVLVGSVVII